MNGDNSVFLVACVIAGAIFNGPWGRTPVYAPVPHETAVVSCEPELRKLLELRDQLDRYRWALLALGSLTLLLLALLAAAACGCICCPLCATRRREAAVRPEPVPKRGDETLLALLAAQEVKY